MDANERHRFRILMSLRKDYRELHDAAGVVVNAWTTGAYKFSRDGDDPNQALARIVNNRDGHELDELRTPFE